MPTIEQLIQTIDGRIREVNREIASLQDARSALTSNGDRSRSSRELKAKSRRRTTRRAHRRKASGKSEVLLAETAERMLARNNGLTTAAVAKEAGAERGQVLALLRDMERANRVRRTGQRRSTRWHAITDEDRIRVRAAELASRSRRRRKSS